jgi:hypothetical protein
LKRFFNAKANGLDFKAFDHTLRHWVTNQGDDFMLNRGESRLKVLKHTKPVSVLNRDSGANAQLNKPLAERQINIIDYSNTPLNRARVVASFFVPNPDDLPFISVYDGDPYNLHADNLYWTDQNHFPVLNEGYEPKSFINDIVIHSPAIRVLRENMKMSNWDNVHTNVTVPVPTDMLHYYKQWKISIQSAVFSALRFMAQWSFVIISIEHKETSSVFIMYLPAAQSIYADSIMIAAREVPWIHEKILQEGKACLTVRNLNLVGTRTEAHDNCKRFMNEYHKNKWHIINEDFYGLGYEREISVKLTYGQLRQINEYLREFKGEKVTLQKYLNATVKTLLKLSDEGDS